MNRDFTPIALPIYQTAAFRFDDAAGFATAATEPMSKRFYTRYGNPTTAGFETAVAALEGAETALALASGMAALTTAVLALVGSGEHIVAQRALYGGTAALLETLAPRLGIQVTFVAQEDAAAFGEAIRPETRLLLLETPSNPLLRLTDLQEVAALARVAKVTTIVDSTIASPINQQPLSLGIDIVMHSATKFLSGHGDVTIGVLAGSNDLIERVWRIAILLGGTLDPHAAALALRGLRTLPMRMAHHNAAGAAVADYLERHPAVSVVHYPGLRSHPQHELACRQMPEGFGGLLSFELAAGSAAAERCIGRLRLAKRSASFGAPTTLVVHPAAMWAGMLDPDALDKAGVPPALLRLGVGFDSADDIIADLEQALA